MAAPSQRPAIRAVPPNIVLISTDDQAAAEMRWMPRTRRLIGRHGVTFRNAINPHPLCCPARAEILTGQYAQNNGVRSNRGRYGGYGALRNDSTIATWLHDAGYRTAFVGKFLNGYNHRTVGDGTQPGWDIWNPTIAKVYGYYGFTNLENGNPRRYDNWHNADYVGVRTAQYIRRFARHDRPFFIWSSQVAPHSTCSPRREQSCWAPPTPAKRYRGMFRHVSSPSLRDRSFNEADVSDKPRKIRNHGLVSRKRINRDFRKRIRSLQAVDAAVARTIRVLRRTGELRNTLVVFTTDNGYLLGEHRFVGKDVPYEQALRVPLLVRGPGVPAGERRRQTAMTIDLAPTFLDVAHAAADLPVDGRSLVPVLRSAQAGGATTALIQSGPENFHEDDIGWHYRGVRTPRYTYAHHLRENFVELYDRKRDPAEMRNVAYHSAYAAVRRELESRLARLADCSGQSCRRRFGKMPAPKPRR